MPTPEDSPIHEDDPEHPLFLELMQKLCADEGIDMPSKKSPPRSSPTEQKISEFQAYLNSLLKH